MKSIMLVLLLSFSVLANRGLAADAWTCQGVCAYVEPKAEFYQFITSSPFTLVTTGAATSGEAYLDALAQCKSVTPDKAQTVLGLAAGGSIVPGKHVSIATVRNACTCNFGCKD